MRLTVLNVGYPFAPVSEDTAGGAEQILAALDRSLRERGHRSFVVGGSAAGLHSREAAYAQHRAEIARALATRSVDLVHMHGLDFAHYLPEPGVPVLVTLHLPPAWYPDEVFRGVRPDTHLVCVSHAQLRACPRVAPTPAVIENGVPVERLRSGVRKRRFALALGRICPEKGFHIALDAAARADMPLLLAGEVFPYPEHRAYFQREIVPRLRPPHRFLGPVRFARKRRLLTAATCILIPSLAAETSSLVAMEALACGTPVIAFPSGALPEIIEHGKTGFLVRDGVEMAAAIGRADRIDPPVCRATARERFSADRMIAQYLETYERVVKARAAVGSRN